MKRLSILSLVLLVIMSGCASSPDSSSESSTSTSTSAMTHEIPDVDIGLMQIYMEDLLDGVYDHEASVYEWEGGFSIHISMEGGMDETTFADFVIDGVASLQEHLPEFDAPLHEFSVSFTISDPLTPSNNGSMLWVTSDLLTGIWSGNAYGRTIFRPDATLADLSDTYGCSLIYPSNSRSKYLHEAVQPIPDAIFETDAEENGLAGTVYIISATIVERKQVSGIDMVIAECNDKQFAVADFMSYASGLDSMFLQVDPSADYSLPPVNATVTMYLTYRGFSGTLNLPIFFLGANEYCVDAIRGE